MPKKNEVSVIEQTETLPVVQQTNSVDVLIGKAIEKGMTAETMEKFLAMRRELKAEAAKEAFDSAMADFQGDCPIIEKKKSAKNAQGTVMYSYAPLDSIVEQVGSIISRHGLSYSFETDNKPERVAVTCIVKHRAGHQEKSVMETSLGNKTQIMSGPQQIAATVTFNKRYAFCNAFGIMTGDEDIDTAGVDTPVPTVRNSVLPNNLKPAASSTTKSYNPRPAVDVVKDFSKPMPDDFMAVEPFPSLSPHAFLVDQLSNYCMTTGNLESQIGKSIYELSDAESQRIAEALAKKISKGEKYQQKKTETNGLTSDEMLKQAGLN